MTPIEQIFGKDPVKLTTADLEGFFQVDREENDRLEFKSYELPTGANDQLKHRENKILQSICGFLNSGGGLLVWGSSSMVSGKSVCKGPLKPVPHTYHKDDFIAKLAEKIIPAPQGIRFFPFTAGTSFVYLIEVEPSPYSPHQVGNRYYMRLDGQTVHAPHHYIEALFKKISFPNLESYVTLQTYEFLNDDKHSLLHFSVLFRNQSPYLNDYDLHCRLFSSQGSLSEYTTKSTYQLRGRVPAEPGDHTDNGVAKIIYYGNWIDRWYTLLLSREHLHNTDYEVDLRLQFGARLSPMKLCLYSINLKKPASNLYANITGMIENRPFNVHEEQMTKTDQERLSETLKRPYTPPQNS